MTKYEEAKEVAELILKLEVARKEVADDLKAKKEELLNLIKENSIDSMFEFNDGVVYMDVTTKYEPADGLKEELEVKSKSPAKISPEFVETYFTTNVKLSKEAKKAIREEDSELLSVLSPVTSEKIKISLNNV